MEEDGLRFECQAGCTKCCDTHGFVYITERDLVRMAAYLGLSAEDFEARYVYRTRRVLRLRKPKAKQCHFLLTGGCQVHSVKPVQCRTYPFWPELIAHRDIWEHEGRRKCPGIGQGPLIHIGTALETAEEMKHAYPWHYGGHYPGR